MTMADTMLHKAAWAQVEVHARDHRIILARYRAVPGGAIRAEIREKNYLLMDKKQKI